MKLISEHFGGDTYPGRRAEIFEDTERGCFIVNYYQEKTIEELVDSREMITQYNENEEPIVHSLRYAEDAAENFCLGYMAMDGRSKK